VSLVAGGLLLLAMAACGSGSADNRSDGGSGSGSGGGGSGGGSGGSSGSSSGGADSGSALSQQVVWPISAQANVLSNNLQIDVDNLYGYATSGMTPLTDVASLAKTLDDTLSTLAVTACASDAKAADAATASHALVAFAAALPAGGGSNAMLTAQDSQVEQLSAALRSAITASPCVSALTPPDGSAASPGGTAISSAVAISGTAGSSGSDLAIPVSASSAYPAIAITNQSTDPLSFSAITVAYADGTSRSIGFGSYPGDGTTTMMSGAADLAGSASLVVDVDARAIKSVTLGAASLGCPLPGAGADGGGGSGGNVGCTGAVTVFGLPAGNGLSP